MADRRRKKETKCKFQPIGPAGPTGATGSLGVSPTLSFPFASGPIPITSVSLVPTGLVTLGFGSFSARPTDNIVINSRSIRRLGVMITPSILPTGSITVGIYLDQIPTIKMLTFNSGDFSAVGVPVIKFSSPDILAPVDQFIQLLTMVVTGSGDIGAISVNASIERIFL